MAQIPLGNFRVVQAVPAAEQGHVVTPDPNGMNRGAQQLAGTVNQIASDYQQQKSAEDKALAKVKASNLLLDRESQLRTITTDLAEKARIGELTHDQLPAAYEAAASKLETPTPQGLDPAEMETFGLSLKQMQLKQLDNVHKVAGVARIGEAQSDIAARMDLLGKAAGMPGADPESIIRRFDQEDVHTAGRMAYGLGWDTQDRAFRDGVYTTHANQQMLGAGNDLGQLQALQHQLTAEDGYYTSKLDPDKRNQLLNTVTGRIYQVEQRNEQVATRREIQAERMLQQMDKQASLGLPPTVADQQRWQSGLAGTSLAGEYSTRVQQMNESQKFFQLPGPAQEQYLTQLKANMQQHGASAADVANLNRLESETASRNKLRDTDPVSYSAITTGSQIEPITFEGIGTPEGQQQLLAQLGERFLVSSSIRRQGGASVTPTPWTQAEQESLSSMSNHMDDKTKLSIFSVIGAATQDKTEYAAAIKPFAGGDLLVDTAGRAAFQGYRLSDGSGLAQTIMDGRKILTDKSKPMPGDDLFRPAFDTAVGFAMPTGSEQRDRAYQTYRAAYAAISERKAKTFNGIILDTEISSQAIQAATGGVTDWAGEKVVKPYGMADADFLVSVGKQIDAASERTGIPAGVLKRMPLRAAPKKPGYYLLMNDGKAQLDPQTQQDLLVKP